MDVSVKRWSMIRPAQDTPKERQWISNLDVVRPTFHVPLLFFYKPNGSSDFFKPQVLQEALSKTLVQFYPMAGRLGRDENGRLEILCNAEGVLWIEAETTSAMDDLDGFTPCSKLRKLVPTADYSGDISSYPLIMAQFDSFVIIIFAGRIRPHFKWKTVIILTEEKQRTRLIKANKIITNEWGESWSEMARGLPQISLPPLIDRTLLRGRVPPIPRFHHLECDPPPSLNTSMSLGPNNHKPSTVSVFKITKNQLNTLKAKSWEYGNKTNYNTYTILAAYIWCYATKVRGLSYDQPTKLNMPINGRPRLHPPLPSTYVGNATLERVHGTLKMMNNEYLRSALDYLETLPDITAARIKPDTYQCPNLNINKWTRLSTYDADFGWGRAIYVGPANIVHEGKIFILPSPTNDGSLSLVACLQIAHMKLFEKHLYEGLKSFDKIKARY
ncbi:hypothetical protein ERO13_D06G201133v2 [Gossypium hirsutum]|nr:hypothetical protein ERO13_D06G201133v2 [Gossypium hirsutum]